MTLAPIDDSSDLIPALPTRADTDSWTEIVAHVSKLAGVVSDTSFVPKGLRGDAPATTAAILYGREVGLPPMTALTQIHVIEGRPGIAAEGMRALVLASGHELVIEEATSATCTMRGRRRGTAVWTPLSWTIDDARRAGLLSKDNWRKYPRAMLVARCTSDLCRMVFPDVIHGFRAIEEIGDMDDRDAPAPDPVAPARTVQRKSARKRSSAAAMTSRPGAAALESKPPPLPEEETETTTATENATPRPAVAVVSDTEEETSDEYVPEEVREEPPVAPVLPRKRPVQDAPRLVNRPTLRLMFREFNRLGVDDEQRDKRLQILSEIAGHDVRSSSELTQEEATRVLTMLSAVADLGALRTLVDMGAVPDDGEIQEQPDEEDDPLPLGEES